MDNTIRAFIALDLSPEIKQELARLQSALKPGPDKIGWVKPDDIHLTLKFLGQADPGKISAIIPILNSLAREYPPLSFTLSHLGAFPSLRSARVIWVGIIEPVPVLAEIVNKLEGRLVELGFKPEERSFKAHLTLGRVKHILNREQFASRINQQQAKPLSFSAQEIILYKSTLTGAGAVYERLAAAAFTRSSNR